MQKREIKGTGRWISAIGFLLLAVLAVAAWRYFAPQPSHPAQTETGRAAPQRAQVYLGPPNSLAVLSFSGELSDPAQAFWATGFARELQRLLTRVPELRVTAWNSSVFFDEDPVPPQLIAERLQVSHLVSGTAVVTNGRVELTVRLYDARAKSELWSETYERSMDEVFALQDELVAVLAEAILPRSPGKLPEAERVDLRAWTHYLRGLYASELKTPDGRLQAEQHFVSALEIAPDFGVARVQLARLWLERDAREDDATAEWVEAARKQLEQARESESALPEALGWLSYIRRRIDWDWYGALEAAEQALRLQPADPERMNTASLALFSLGRFPEAGELLMQSIAQDPLNLARRLRLGLLQEFSGQYGEAVNSYRQLIAFNENYPGARAYLARVRIMQGKPEAALSESEQEVDPFWQRYSRILALIALGRDSDAQALLDLMIEDDAGHSAYQITEILAYRGDIDLAFEWFQRAYEQHDGGMGEVIGNSFLAGLHTDPRWGEMLERLGLASVEPESIPAES